ncbi:MAG: DNA topoisomerase VI subunit B [Crenarchaeota archaeon]|nr:DNA topoisomerase VI subunit B [Thermoproteota archaeon]
MKSSKSIEIRYEELSPAEWFRRNKELAGLTNPTRAMYQTIREFVENSLDATESYGILPSIKIKIDYYDKSRGWVSVYVEDNGIGIPDSEIPNVFGRVFYSSKYRIRQHRGVFGLGAKMIILYAQSTTNKPIYVRSAPLGSDKIYEYVLMINTLKNEPIILERREYENKYKWHGTAVKVIIEGDWSRAKKRVEEYLKRTYMIAPYAEIVLKAPDLFLCFPRVTTKLPPPPKEGLPHPKSVDVELIKHLIARNPNLTLKEFLTEYFDGVGKQTAEAFLKWAKLDPNKKVGDLTEDEITELTTKMREFNGWRRPKADWLSPVGEELLVEGIRKVLEPEFVAAVTRKPSSYMGHPFIVEAAIAWGGKIPPSERPIVYRFANKVPLLYDEGSDVIRKVVEEIDWSVYKVKFPAPLAVIVHVCSTKIPYVSAGKEAIADVVEIEEEIMLAIREVARKLRQYITKKEKEEEIYIKYATFSMYAGEVASALSYVTGKPAEEIKRKLQELIIKKVGIPPVPEKTTEVKETSREITVEARK